MDDPAVDGDLAPVTSRPPTKNTLGELLKRISFPVFPCTCSAPTQAYCSFSGQPRLSLLPREKRLEREPQGMSSGVPAPLPFVAGIN